ncbi:putative aldouronate transport system permease protein [Paenibacillus sp. UNC496MF]|uniref:ABC transporter permease n=1 Tax=Paenibacillus sp. UNC496MF TaxID=1502753 RepID=UPI0008E3BF29|nr:ABC transporter permease subunit [Paenibacillus sp. UNC496MF]SFI37055.1 putative aldouronate transport system permease protein [Paenibacillus sp. UNC496MF]
MKLLHALTIPRRQLALYVMLIAPVAVLFVYAYLPMFGVVMSFQRFEPSLGFFRSDWVGFANFRRLAYIPDVKQVVLNTLFIASMKIVVETLAAIVVAVLLNEIVSKLFRRVVQTIIYFPYFLSWVILGGILRDLLSREGLINMLLGKLGFEPVVFLSKASLFPYVLVGTETWQVTGFGTIVFLAAITTIDPTLYEAAVMDGASRFKQILHITIPGIKSTIILMMTLSMGYILNAGFEQVLMLYSPLVYSTGDVIDTWVYRMGLQQSQYSLASAIGLFRSVVSLALISVSYYVARKVSDHRIF